MKILIIILISIVFLFSNINKEILLIEAKLYPKIIELIKNLQNKEIIKVAILVNSSTLEEGNLLKRLMKGKRLKVDIINKICSNYDVYIITYPLKNIEKLIRLKKVIFSTEPDYIDKSMFSIFIGVRVYPYLNPVLIKKANLKIDPILFKVGRIYE